MNYKVTINFETDGEEVLESIKALLESTLPYMVDNVNIYFDTEE
jgi:hypothetical protein